MNDERRAARPAGLNDLRSSPEHYSLFAALRLIEQVNRDRPRLGESRKAADDPVRIHQRPHLYFAPSEVVSYGQGDGGGDAGGGCVGGGARDGAIEAVGGGPPEGSVPRLDQHGFGIFGPNGALPLHLTELAYAREHQSDDPTLSDFVNAFQHRFASLFYRAWADSDPCASFDRTETDPFRLYIGALIGLGPAAARDRDGVLDYAKLSRVGLFAPQSRSAESLEQILREYFELQVEVIPFTGGWMEIPPDARCRLGGPPEYASLGAGATAGATTWQCQSRFEIALGPLAMSEFVNFLPGARGLTQLKALVRLYTNEEWSWQVRLLLRTAEIPPVKLGESGWLGWTSWMPSSQAGADAVVRDALIEGSQPAAAG